jgi:hypothetical protein
VNIAKWFFLCAGGVLLGGGTFIYPYLAARDHLSAWALIFSLPLSAAAFAIALRGNLKIPSAGFIVAAILPVTLLVEWAAESWWPNSADEYGYTFLARTLLHERLWNPSPPVPLIFDFAWIFSRNHKWFSQYPPAWSALLAPFLACGVAWVLNPLLNLSLGLLTSRTLRLMRVGREITAATLLLLMFTPFTVFNGASLFAHTFTAVLIMGIILLQTRDEIGSGLINKLGIGALFGVLMMTRYEVFVLTASCYVLDRLWYRRTAFVRDALTMGIGGLPMLASFFAYNLAITGRLFKTPYGWVSSGAKIGLWGKHVIFWHALGDAVLRTLHWSGELLTFTSPLIVLLIVFAVVAKLRVWSLRFYDIMFPVAFVFFFLYPNTGGHEFGPRYWFFAWPGAMLSIATGLANAETGNWLQFGRLRLHASSLAAAHLPIFLGVTISIAAFTHLYVDARRRVYDAVPPQLPALVLIPTRNLMITPLQTEPIIAHSADFCRNGVDLNKDVLYGRADILFKYRAAFTVLACRVPGRHLYLWRAPGVLDPVACPPG